MFGRFVIGIPDAFVLCFQVFDALRLTFERDDGEVVAVEEREHVARDVEHQHALSVFEFLERELFLHIIAQRQAVLAIVFDIHCVRKNYFFSEPHSAFPAQSIKARRRSLFITVSVFSRAKIKKILKIETSLGEKIVTLPFYVSL